jgi:hypothetical protein
MNELAKEIAGAGEPVRLEGHDEASLKALTSSTYGRNYLRRVVTIIIDDRDPPNLANDLEAAVYAAKSVERLSTRLKRNAQLCTHHYRRKSVERVVAARHTQRDWTQALLVAPDLKRGLESLYPQISRRIVCVP